MLFALLATANAAGYRYGVSDQAFYLPVVVRALDPAAFPRDGVLIDAQGRLMLYDEFLAALVRSTGLSLETLFLAGYLLSLALIWAGLRLIGSRLYQSAWATAALAAAFTLRHRIARTSANSFEPYFHPRMLAFGLGVLAVAAFLRRRSWTAIALVALSAPLHVTTAMWFAVLLGTAMVVLDTTLRRLAIPAIACGLAVAVWMVTAGPLAASLTRMDAIWLTAVASKDSLFASDWPLWAWLLNLAMLGLVWWAHRARVRRGTALPEERALAWGATALVGLFLATLPLVTMRLALPTQLQISRVFWLVDFVALVFVIGVVADGRRRAGTAMLALLVAVSGVRGVYVMTIEHPERRLFALSLTGDAWNDAMRWLASRPKTIHVLADPGHAWKYGTTVRVAAARDVFLEEVKDSALAIYSRDVAVRVVERTRAVGDYGTLTAERARQLAGRYNLHYVVTESDLPLPLAYRAAQFRIYRLNPE